MDLPASDRLRLALMAVAEGEPITLAQESELEEAGWGGVGPKAASAELAEQERRGGIYRCCAPDCKGYSFKASERPHPCAPSGHWAATHDEIAIHDSRRR